MQARRFLFLVLTAILFFLWIGYLAVLVWQRPVVVARAPFLVADLNVVASIPDLEKNEATVKEVVWAREPKPGDGLEGKTVHVTNLSACRADWRGPGEYLLPLLRTGDDLYEVADATGFSEAKKREEIESHRGVPTRSPGYEPYADREARTLRPPRIYRATPETQAQVRQMHPAK
jgi:hypothetical protein